MRTSDRRRRVARLVGLLVAAVAMVVSATIIYASRPPETASPVAHVEASVHMMVAETGAPGPSQSPTPLPHSIASSPFPGPSAPSTVAASPTASPARPSAAVESHPGLETPRVGVIATRIRVPRLGIDLPVVEGDGSTAPIGKAAHYPGTAWPGEGSNIYIYGHAQKGMFLELWEAAVGDRVELDLADGTTRMYRVRKIIPKVPADAVGYLAPTSTEQLTLQTSTSYVATAPRFLLIAVPVG